MVIFAYLLSLNPSLGVSEIRVLRIIENEAGVEEARSHLQSLLVEARVDGKVRVLVSDDAAKDVIAQESFDAELVFLGMELPEEGHEEGFMDVYDALTEKLKNVVIVKSTGRSDVTA